MVRLAVMTVITQGILPYKRHDHSLSSTSREWSERQTRLRTQRLSIYQRMNSQGLVNYKGAELAQLSYLPNRGHMTVYADVMWII